MVGCGLQDEYPGILRFACSVFPSEDDDVVTSPYNALLALHQLLEHADCVLPVENQALQEIAARLEVSLKLFFSGQCLEALCFDTELAGKDEAST